MSEQRKLLQILHIRKKKEMFEPLTSAELECMYRNKEEFIKRLQLVFKADKRSGVMEINYHRNFDGVPEVVEIVFEPGHSKYINTTWNSNGANCRNIVHAVYGGEVVGEFFRQ